MCGRFNIISDPLTRLLLEITGQDFILDDRLNLAPTEAACVLLKTPDGEWELKDMRWWLVPYWSPEPSSKYAMFNARAESLGKSRAFREPFRKRRAVIPVSGYYEWRKEGGVKVPYYITPAEDNGFAFAGLWDRWRRDDREILSCTIVTTASAGDMTDVHNRMPVQLTADGIRQWINQDTDAGTLQQLLAPELRVPTLVTPVSTRVNNARHKDLEVLQPVGESRLLH